MSVANMLDNIMQYIVSNVYAFSSVISLFTLFAIYKQFRAMYKTLQVNMLISRRELYYTTNSLPEEMVNAMMMHVFDHFNSDVYKDRYENKQDRIRSYLLMKRKYLYLLLSESVEADGNDLSKMAPDKWLEELCAYQEFRDVHDSQKHYYPRFARKVDALIEKKKIKIKGWALSENKKIGF